MALPLFHWKRRVGHLTEFSIRYEVFSRVLMLNTTEKRLLNDLLNTSSFQLVLTTTMLVTFVAALAMLCPPQCWFMYYPFANNNEQESQYKGRQKMCMAQGKIMQVGWEGMTWTILSFCLVWQWNLKSIEVVLNISTSVVNKLQCMPSSLNIFISISYLSNKMLILWTWSRAIIGPIMGLGTIE